MAPHEGHGFSRAAQNSASEGFSPWVRVSMLRSEQNLPATTVPQRLKPSMHKRFKARLKQCPS
jgi:hypothetical protein